MSGLVVNTFILLLVVIDPVGLAPMFGALSQGMSAPERARVAGRAVLLAGAILVGFAVAGRRLLGALGVGLPAFQIAGGVLLFLLAIDMVFARQSGLRSATPAEQREAARRSDISVFPLAFPLIAGPGALTTVLLVLTRSGVDAATYAVVFGVLAAVLAMTYAALRAADRLMRWLGETGANVISRLLGLVLAALAVQFVLNGLGACRI